LLDVQALDTHVDQLAHRRATLPEHAELAEVDTTLAALAEQLVVVETEMSDVTKELSKAEGDVEQVRTRASRDQQRMDAGQVSSPKELEGLQHEIATLARRQSDLEDIVLDVMERLESAQSRHSELTDQQAQAQERRLRLVASRDSAVAGIETETAALTAQRDTQAGSIDADLLTLYEKIRAQQAGIGTSELKMRRCTGCRLELNTVELGRIRDADEDEVLRCEECRRILVRTPESGL
jgi:predicted  nucleic acid-binding Zn-ribbon protein